MSVERVRDARKIVDANAYATLFDTPDVRLARADHHSKAFLGKPLVFPALFDRIAERASFLVDIHAYRICARLSVAASYLKPKN